MQIVNRIITSLVSIIGCAAMLGDPAHAAPDIKPRIVLQSAINGTEIAAWTPDDRYIVTAFAAAHVLVIWEAASGIIIDTVRLPGSLDDRGSDYTRLTGIEIAPDGATALIHGIAADLNKTDGAKSLEYSVDLATRSVRALPPRSLPAGTKGVSGFLQQIKALTAITEGSSGMTAAAAEKLLPALPRSHDGRFVLKRAAWGTLVVEGTRTVRTLATDRALGYSDAALAPDGRRLALVTDSESDTEAGDSTLEWFDLTTASYSASVRVDGDYGVITWLDANSILASYETDSDERDASDPDNAGAPDPMLVIDAATGKTLRSFPARCYVHPLAGGRFIGVGLANCRAKVGTDHGVAIYDPARATWQMFATPWLQDMLIDSLAVSPDGATIAFAVMQADQNPGLVVVDLASGKTVDTLSYAKASGFITNIRFAPDGKTLIIAVNGGLHQWKPGDAASHPMTALSIVPQMMVNDGKTLLTSGAADDAIARIDLATGKSLPSIAFASVVAGGFVPDKPLFWAASYFGGVRVWDTRTWTEILTTYHFPDRKFLAVTPEGVYDTNLGPDAKQFRWIVPDAPFQSLAPQTFMRDYFEPRLTQRRIECTIAGTCAQVFKPLPPIAALNRLLPYVGITDIRPDATGTKALVTVRVVETFDMAAKNGKTRSGVYAVRLFRNNRLVAQTPALDYHGPYVEDPLAASTSNDHEVLVAKVNKIIETQPEVVENTMNREIGAWRTLNRVQGVENNPNMVFTVDLPTAASGLSEFSAYAFNEDRVKSDTARMMFRPGVTTPRQPRAFVIAIGIDAYDEPRLALRFAAGDAKLIAARLAAIPGYEVHAITLTGERGADGKTRRVTRRSIQLLLSALGTGDAKAAKQAFADAGLDASALASATPDDIVILSFSGHGWADPRGNFYLVPSDGKWPAGDAAPDKSTLISAAELTRGFTAVQAGEIVLIIDACHSGASVDTAGFKPGPMGDAGLGQLAFDKGMRILAASQASDVALEDPVLRQGLLTYALAGEGIMAIGGKADENDDGRITIDEWLRYAVGRLPSLSEDTRLGRFGAPASGGAAGSRDFDLLDAMPTARPKAQEPALFDFTGIPSPVVLRKTR